jgi:hypothetical protein
LTSTADLLRRLPWTVSAILTPVCLALSTVNPCVLVAFLPGLAFLIAHAHALATADALLLPLWALLIAAFARWIQRQRGGVLLELRPQADSPLTVAAWSGLFQSLYGMVRPWWKAAILGQSWVVFEFVHENGHTLARCWTPPELEGMVRSLLRSAAPGVDIATVKAPAPARLPKPAARARLGLWRESLIPLSGSRLDALYPALNALSEAPHASLQVALRPDTGWQRRAVRRLHRHVGNPAPRSLPVRALLIIGRTLFALAVLAIDKRLPARRARRPIRPLSSPDGCVHLPRARRHERPSLSPRVAAWTV